ncbi:MAG: hypothetical protein IT260_17595 [Saprospiraceae bacterium]|nr:hypothetical protein [Saprospiraceae bacterium]
MNAKLILAACFAFGALAAQSQCIELQLSELQNLQRVEPDLRESKIQDLGFDLRSTFTSKGASYRNYSKCWVSTVRDKTTFEQLIWWNETGNSITWFTLNEQHFSSLRKAIVERNPSGSITENPDFYNGRMFQYRFGNQRVDGAEYYFVTISKR